MANVTSIKSELAFQVVLTKRKKIRRSITDKQTYQKPCHTPRPVLGMAGATNLPHRNSPRGSHLFTNGNRVSGIDSVTVTRDRIHTLRIDSH